MMVVSIRNYIKYCWLVVAVFVLLVAGGSVFAAQKDLPEAPKGYAWKWCGKIKAGFLMPKGWHYKQENKKDTESVYISKESIEKDGFFKTGLTVNALKNSREKTGVIPSEYAKMFIEAMKTMPEVEGRDIKEFDAGLYIKGYSGFFRSPSTDNEMIVQYTLALGNDVTGALYLINFESPEVDWKNAWKTGQIIMDNLALDSEF